MVKNEGFQEDIVKYVLDCLLYSLHKTGNVPVAPTMPAQETTAKPSRNKKSEKANLKVMEGNGNYLIELNVNL